MSTLRISNIEAKSVPASATVDEKVKITNSSGDTLVFIDGKTSGITTVGINTTDSNITFDANSNVVVTGIITATRFSGQITPTSLEIGSNIKLGNAGVITATSFVGSGAQLTGITSPAITSIGSDGTARVLTSDGDGTATAHSEVKIETVSGNKRLSINRGTGSTEVPLLVRRTDASGIVAEFSNSGGYGVYIGQNGATGEGYIRTATGQPLVFTTNSGSGITNERLRITSAGVHKITQSANLTDGSFYSTITISSPNGVYQGLRFDRGNVAKWRIGMKNDDTFQIANLFHNGSAGAEDNCVRITDNDDINITGNLKISTAGNGISFAATGDSAGNQGSSELLDDYEEGSWTPQFKAGNNSTACPTTVNEAKYTKVGRLVTATAYFTMSSYASGTTGGDTRIVGLPYQNIGDHGGATIHYWSSLKQNVNFMAGTVQGSSSEILIRATTSASTGTSNIDFDNTFGPSDSLILTATYHTS